jgi:hypothetical protein
LEVIKRKKRRLMGQVLIAVGVAKVSMMMAMMTGTKETRKRCPAITTTCQRSLAWKAEVLAEVGRLFLGWLVLVQGSSAARFISCVRVRSLQQRMMSQILASGNMPSVTLVVVVCATTQ